MSGHEVETITSLAGLHREYFVFPSKQPRMTQEEMVADAATRIAAAVQERAQTHYRQAIQTFAVVASVLARQLSGLLTEEMPPVRIDCPCCGLDIEAGDYVTHALNPPADCDRVRWADLAPVREFINLDDELLRRERVVQ